MNKELFQVNLAVVMGIGIGALLCVFGQKAINAHSIRTCPSKPDHVLIRMNNSFVGDAVYCVERKYV
jgi:hypothetical protein